MMSGPHARSEPSTVCSNRSSIPSILPGHGTSWVQWTVRGGATVATKPQVNILAISDEVEAGLYGPGIRDRFGHADLVLSCGDLPDYYLDYITSVLNVP